MKIDFETEIIECVALQLAGDGYDEIEAAAWVMLNAIKLSILLILLESSQPKGELE